MTETELSPKERYDQKKQAKLSAKVERQLPLNWSKWLLGAAVVIAILGVGYWIGKDGLKPGATAAEAADPMVVKADDWSQGPATASARLIEYADFECPGCGAYYSVVQKLKRAFPDQLQVVYRHFPLISLHPNALPAARAAEAAGKQGKFFEMAAKLYSSQDDWSREKNAKAKFESYVQAMGLNVDQFRRDYDDSAILKRINDQRHEGEKLGIHGTPTFFLNGQKIDRPPSEEDFKRLIEDAIKNRPIVASTSAEPKFHAHFNLKVVLAGKPIDFVQDKYQSKEGAELDDAVHLHDKNGEVVHLHAKAVTLDQFFKSLKMELTKDCFKDDNGSSYCTNQTESLKLYVNDKAIDQFESYQPQDLDRILISYGPKDDPKLQTQLDSVGNNACIYSEKCPERGTPPPEAGCVGGLGSGCDE